MLPQEPHGREDQAQVRIQACNHLIGKRQQKSTFKSARRNAKKILKSTMIRAAREPDEDLRHHYARTGARGGRRIEFVG